MLSSSYNYSYGLVQRGYVRVKTIRLLGIVLSVFVRYEHVMKIRHVDTQYVRLSMGGFLVRILNIQYTSCSCGS